MERKHGAANCGWAVATLFMPEPMWLDAQDCPWTCLRDPQARPLETTVECATCARWEAFPERDPRQPLRVV